MTARGVSPRRHDRELARRAALASSQQSSIVSSAERTIGKSTRSTHPCQAFANSMPTVVSVHDDERGCYLGRTGTTNVFSGARRSALVLGPTRSGKTSSLLVPNVLLASSSVVATSTKDDVLRATAARADNGHVLLFDPSGTIACPPSVRRVGWSPIHSAVRWDDAVHTADAMVDAARLRARGHGAIDHWTERARTLLAPLLHAAALGSRGVGDLAGWVDLRDGREPMGLLAGRHGPVPPGASLALAGSSRPTTASSRGSGRRPSGVLGAWRTDAARAAADLPQLDVAAFLAGPNTLHVVSPSRHQVATAPLVAGLLDSLVHATYDAHAEGASLLLALDELANVAPLPVAAVDRERGRCAGCARPRLPPGPQPGARAMGRRRRGIPVVVPDDRRAAGDRGSCDARCAQPARRPPRRRGHVSLARAARPRCGHHVDRQSARGCAPTRQRAGALATRSWSMHRSGSATSRSLPRTSTRDSPCRARSAE